MIPTNRFFAAILLSFSALGVTTAIWGVERVPHSFTADEAFRELNRGNKRFVESNSKHPHLSSSYRHSLESGQHPHTVILGCSDSRVTPEIIFDQGLGDLFVVRVAGNIADTDVAASIEYATDHLETKLVVVLGHTCCGAVSATVDLFDDVDGEPAEVVALLDRIEPAVAGVPTDLPRDERISAAVQRNVELSVRRLSRVPDLHHSIQEGRLKIVGATYDMHTGIVTFLDRPAKHLKK